jgi:hypothetical protein
MLSRLTGDGSSEMPVGKFQSFRFQSFKAVCGEETVGRETSDAFLLRHKEGEPQAKPLLADAEFRDDGLIALGIVFLEVVQQATPLADQHEKPAARAVVFLVRLEVLRQLANAFAKQSDLDLWAPGIAGSSPVLVNEGFFLLSG